MIFLPSDCFSELSNISPGCHGWIFIFRTDLKEWLLKTIDPFFMTYQNLNGQKTEFGVYEAIQFSEGNMAGPEIARLSQSVGIAAPFSSTPTQVSSDSKYHCCASKQRCPKKKLQRRTKSVT